MKLVAPAKVKMHKKTLEQGVEYTIGAYSGSIYLHGVRLFKGNEFEKSPEREDNSLERMVHSQEGL